VFDARSRAAREKDRPSTHSRFRDPPQLRYDPQPIVIRLLDVADRPAQDRRADLLTPLQSYCGQLANAWERGLIMPSPSLKGVAVLLVEDHADSREALGLWLEHLGATVSMAGSAVDAYLVLAKGLAPHVILCDLRMPGQDGLEFRARLRNEPGLACVPVVAITGDVEAASGLVALGFDGCLLKPASIQAVAETIGRVLGR
jgi:CheY-like chemotaxis protein